MKTDKIILALLFGATAAIYAQPDQLEKRVFTNLSPLILMETHFNFSNLKGKKVLVVNTASKCGLTCPVQKTTGIV